MKSRAMCRLVWPTTEIALILIPVLDYPFADIVGCSLKADGRSIKSSHQKRRSESCKRCLTLMIRRDIGEILADGGA